MGTTAEPVTLPEFVRLLQRAHGPAVERLTADDPPWVAMAYIDDKIACLVDDEVRTTGSARGAARRQWLSLSEHRRSRSYQSWGSSRITQSCRRKDISFIFPRMATIPRICL